MKKTKKILLNTLKGNNTWPPPVWLMRQAGRYLPEFRKLREKADFLTRCLTPDIATELTLQPIRRYHMDGAIVFSDILILPYALGQNIKFIENKGPVLDPIRSEEDLNKLNLDRMLEKTYPIREALKLIKKSLPVSSTLIGFAGSPFTVSCYMIEGKGSRLFLHVRNMMLKNKYLFQKIINLLTLSTIEMLKEQIEAGAETIMLFDSWAGILPPDEFREFVIKPTIEIVKSLKDSYPDIPIIGFPRLAGNMINEYITLTQVDAISLDTVTDIEKLSQQTEKNITFQGNLDPSILLNGGEKLKREVIKICKQMYDRPHIFNLGHGVIKYTDPENVSMLVETIRNMA